MRFSNGEGIATREAGGGERQGSEEGGRGQTRNAQEKWQITIVIKMAIWMIKGSLELQEWRNGREKDGGKEGRKEGRKGHAFNERQEKSAGGPTD